MTVRSDRLASGICPAGGQLDLFFPPPGQTWLVKRICAFNEHAVVGGIISWYMLLPGPDFTLFNETVPAQTARDREVWWPFDPDAGLKIAVTSGPWQIAVFGAKLIGVA